MRVKKEIKQLREEIAYLREKYITTNEEKLTLANVLSVINEELEASLQNEKRFIASVSHELRTPMTAIIGYSELMSDTDLDRDQKRYMKSIKHSSNYLLSLVNDLLDVAKLKDKRVELNPKVVDLTDILSECVILMESKISEEVTFEVELPTLDYKVKADDKRIKQIVLNLLSNAAKFTKSGTIRLYLDPLIESANNQLQVTMHIEDTGIGIPAEVQETLFKPFCSTDKTQGTGLGLFISKELVELMNGTILLSSIEGEGSHFIVEFFVERSIKKEVGKGLIGTNILMCSEKNSFVNSLEMEFSRMHMDSFEHFNLSLKSLEELTLALLPKAKEYDIVIFDLDVLGKDAVHIANIFSMLNPQINMVSYLSDENKIFSDIFSLTIYKPLGHQSFIRQLEETYSKKVLQIEQSDYSHLKILLVEDVDMNRIYQVEMLRKFFKIECDTAENGAVALEKAKNNHYDAILMDMRMPIMDGLEATQKIREFNQEIPIICMSANVYKEDKISAYESGMNDFIEKPLERLDIENSLLKLINNEFSQESQHSVDYKKIAYQFLRENFEEEIVQQLCETAEVSIRESVENISLNYTEMNPKELRDNFHQLKGVFLNLGLNDLASEAGELQKYAEEEDFMKLMEEKESFLERVNNFIL